MAATRALCNYLGNAPANAVDAGDLVGCPGGDRATQSSLLAWEIPWTEEPGCLEFMGSQRVRHE